MQFHALFLETYVPQTLRDRKKDDFMALEQVRMIVAAYESKFHALSRYEIPGRENLKWEGVYKPKPPKFISFVRSRKLVGQGYLAYLTHIWDVDVESQSVESIPIVSEFNEVFHTNFPGMPPDRDIDFYIDLEPATRPISIPPYCMALAYFRDLKAEIQELLDIGFIRSSASLGRAPVLFIKKNDDDILVYSKIMEERVDHLCIVLGVLGKQKLYAKIFKCEFWLTSIAFSGHVVSNEGYEVITDNHSLQHVFTQKDKNLRHRGWMELLKDYYVIIQYRPGKANMVADILSQKTVSMGSLAFLGVSKRPLAKEIQTFKSKFMLFVIRER
ncbi:hypothetical protein MTR67_026564 [Solanum verrucosum]|uniref:Reverse transcriptase RNase H-like domain-containing protein n=1 Tax=Solanum verrucosum TaxID=315347 RepID=A0AAF0QZ63_SOLVR|nr:hypothetical protein MTR67_026564 [Solanum verrucosum]